MSARKAHHITLKETQRVVPEGGVAALDEVVLSKWHERMLARAAGGCNGPAAWRNRKLAEARDLLALAQISGRMTVGEIDLRESLRALVRLRVPVPLEPDEAGRLRLADQAVLGVTYRQEAVRLPQPGFSFVQLLAPPFDLRPRDPRPPGVWHANVGRREHGQPVCLGETLDAGIPVKEIILLTYGALSMQSVTVMIDEQDSAGVMNHRAARWWQQNVDRIPLSREPFVRARGG